MLIIDDNMFRLAKMQAALLKVSSVNREENLRKYKQIVSEIDAKAFADVLDEMKQINKHNHSYESELSFLEEIEKVYDQLLELQTSFKRVCELYGDLDFKLSDLSRLNIQYIKSRIGAINAHLTNLKNIERNEEEIKQLNSQLRELLKQKSLLDCRLLELETSLRDNFASTEGRIVEDGKLIPTSVLNEYKKIGLDFNLLLSDTQTLEKLLSTAASSRTDKLDTLRTMEVCYNNMLSDESKQFLDGAKVDYLNAEYMLIMLKIVKLLSGEYTEYDMVVKKREDLLILIEDRFSCLKCLGKAKKQDRDLDPFVRTKVQEQSNTINGLVDCSRDIDKISKKISDLVTLTEKMTRQKADNQIMLTDTRELIEDKISMSDIVGTYLPIKEIRKGILPNQVVDVKSLPEKFNMVIVKQKTAGVISRVNKMVNKKRVDKKKSVSTISPDLVIVPKSLDNVSTHDGNDISQPVSLEIVVKEDVIDNNTNELPKLSIDKINDDLFETILPFEKTVMFSDRSDEEELNVEEEIVFPVVDKEDVVAELPTKPEDTDDSFWVVNDENQQLSFDEQVQMLILPENDEKVRKKVA